MKFARCLLMCFFFIDVSPVLALRYCSSRNAKTISSPKLIVRCVPNWTSCSVLSVTAEVLGVLRVMVVVAAVGAGLISRAQVLQQRALLVISPQSDGRHSGSRSPCGQSIFARNKRIINIEIKIFRVTFYRVMVQ